MDDRRALALRRIDDAFLQRKFSRDHSRPGLHYAGVLDETGLRTPVVVSVNDLDFVRPPVIKLVDPQAGSTGQIPHVLRFDGTFCYYDGEAIVLDRYKPAETIIQCLERADKVLRDAVRGRLDEDLAGEFGSYWSAGTVLIDLPEDFEGDARIQALRFGRDPALPQPVVSNGKSKFLSLHRRNSSGSDPEGVLCPVVVTPTLSFNPKQTWPPKDLGELNAWLKQVAPSAAGVIEETFVRSKGHRQWICLSAPNGRFFILAELDKPYRTPEILENRRAHLATTLQHIQGAVKISGYVGVPIDEGYVFSRNLGNMKSLAGKRILLVGCGTIGSFLAQNLAQSGAGAGGGKLLLVDNDTLKGANLGRHLLGAPYLGRNKAEACSEFLSQQLPHLDISSRLRSILADLNVFAGQDLIIDATGEEALSIALNEFSVGKRPDSPPVLFAWLEGNGAATVAFMTGSEDYACLKCLKPELAGLPRFDLLKDRTQLEIGSNLACGDAHFVPFPVSRATAAASLACDMALDWANGGKGHRWRSMTLDHRRAIQIKDSNPKRLAACPACGGRLQ